MIRMAIEIERKFLVCGDGWRDLGQPVYYCQGYLNSGVNNNTVRIRIAGDLAMLTVKGPTKGMKRLEFEYVVPMDDAREMLELCGTRVEKNRTKIPLNDVVWEVDEFFGANEGLILAEVELHSEHQAVELPAWIGEEVTGDPRYFNSRLAQEPFRAEN